MVKIKMAYMTLVWLLVFVLCTQGQEYDEVCYPPCGCFTNEYPFDTRPLPESPEEQEIVWRLYTQDNPDIAEEITWDENGNVILPDVFDPSRKLKFLVHGWTVSGPDPRVGMGDMKNAFLSKYDYNCIVVDWKKGSNKPTYLPATSNARVVGSCAAHIAYNSTTNLDDVHCMGHSLGGQVCGFMGDHTSGLMGRATGLDPAGPGFFEEDPELRLDKEDAKFVEVLHTNIEGVLPALGLGAAIGHADFYPNKGHKQPPCGPTNSCDHSICQDYYYASILEEEDANCQFWANPCNSEEDADAGLCETCTEGVDCQKMGYYANTMPGNGSFYLRTTEEYPYCEN